MSTHALLALLLFTGSLCLSFIRDVMKAMDTYDDHPLLTMAIGAPISVVILGLVYGGYYLAARAFLILIGVLA